MLVKLVQFKRPDGRQVEVTCEVSDDLRAQYEAIIAANCRLTCEVLTTDDIALAVEHEEGEFDTELCENAPDKPKKALETLIRRFRTVPFTRWLLEVRG